MKGISTFGKKPKPVGPTSYGRTLARFRKLGRRRKPSNHSNLQKKLIPSETPINFGPQKPVSTNTGYLFAITIFLGVVAFLILVSLRS